MSFDAKDYSISEILTKSVFDIPRNQRRYVWKKDRWNDLFEDLVFSISQKKAHFLGSFVLEEDSKDGGLSYYTIIDGQQRLTTITLLLLAIMKHFRENGMNDDFLGTVSYVQSKDTSNKDVVIIRSDYHTSLASLVTGIIGLEEQDQSITAFINAHILSKTRDNILGDALQFFYNAIKADLKKSRKAPERLRNLRKYLLDMVAVKIVSTSEEDSYTVFEILNARGQDLDDHELLKNYIMRYILPQKRRDDAKAKWEELETSMGTALNKFIKHYATHKYGNTSDKYSSPYQAIQKATHGRDVAKLFDDIKLKAEYYKKIIHPSKGRDGNCTNREFEVFDFFRVKRFEQFRPILLSLIHQKELEKLSQENYERILLYIYNFFVCYTIIGEEKSNKLEDAVFKYARQIEENYSDELLREFANNLKQKLPGYDWFLNAFKNVGWSNHYGLYQGEKNKTRVQIILEVIERYVCPSGEVREFTIEHIIPDSEGVESAQIGNLIPLEERLNTRCKDKPIEEKLPIYDESSFTLARGIVKRFQGKEFKPESRTEYLAELLYNDILGLNQFGFE